MQRCRTKVAKLTLACFSNYGPRIKRPKYGSRGTRVNLKVLEEIFQWVGVSKKAKTLQVRGVKIPYPLSLTWSQEDQALRVVVQQSTNPALMKFDVLPVYGPPVVPGQKIRAEFGFSQQHSDVKRWVSWNVEWRSATLVDDLRRARPGLWTTNRSSGSVEMLWQGSVWELAVRTDSSVVKKFDLEEPGAEFSGVDYETSDNRIDVSGSCSFHYTKQS